MSVGSHQKSIEQRSVITGIFRNGLLIFLLTLWNLSIGWGQSGLLFAQSPLNLDPTGRSGEPPALEKKTTPAPTSPPPDFILPPIESLPELQPKRTPQLGVMVRTIHVEGNTVFTPEELSTVTAPYENRQLSTEDIEELRRNLTLLYINKGYVNSGAIIPDQSAEDGQITYQIIEGALTDIRIEGTTNFLSDHRRRPNRYSHRRHHQFSSFLFQTTY